MNTWRTLVALAWPTVFSGWTKASFVVVDTYSAGQLKGQALAGLASGVLFGWLIHSLGHLTSSGTLAFCAQARGAGDDDRARRTYTDALALAVGCGLFTSVAFYLLADPLIRLLDLPPDTHAHAVDYVQGLVVLGPFFWIAETSEQAFRAFFDVKTPLYLVVAAALVNVALNPILTLGAGPIPALGLFGTGLATGISWVFMSLALLFFAVRRGYLTRPSSAADILLGAPRLMRVGLPLAITNACFDLIWMVLTPYVVMTGPAALAAIGVGHRMEALGYLTGVGVGHATSALVGHATGAADRARALDVNAKATVLATALIGVWAACLLLFPTEIVGFFTDEHAVIEMCRDYLAVSALSMVLQGWEQVGTGAFEGTGRTVLPTAIAIVGYGARIPLVAMVVVHGHTAIFLTVAATAVLCGLCITLAFVFIGSKAVPQRA